MTRAAYVIPLALALGAAPASAHAPLSSTSDVLVSPDGTVDLRLVLSMADAARALDADGDGRVDAVELERRAADVRLFVDEGVGVARDDGEGCAGGLRRAAVDDDGAGVVLEGAYDCGRGAHSVTLTLFFLASMGRHHHVAAVTGGAPVRYVDLSSTRRSVTVEVPRRLVDDTPSVGPLAVRWALLALALLGLSALLWAGRRLTPRRIAP